MRRNLVRQFTYEQSAKPGFAELMTDAQYTFVSVHACVRFTRVWRASWFGVERLENLSKRGRCSAKRWAKGGFVGNMDSSLIELLTRSSWPHILEFFQGFQGLTALPARLQGVKNIIDTELPKLEVSCCHFRARVWRARLACVSVSLKPLRGMALRSLNNMARCQDARHSDRYSMQTTLFYTLNSLKEEYAGIRSKKLKANCSTSWLPVGQWSAYAWEYNKAVKTFSGSSLLNWLHESRTIKSEEKPKMELDL